MKMGLDALRTTENMSENAKHENGSRRTRYRCATLFRALRTAAGRWDAEEGHEDPSQACICLMPADSAV
jgi:hypothetical protein